MEKNLPAAFGVFTLLLSIAVAILVAAPACAGADRVAHLPELPMPRDLYARFQNPGEVEAYLKKNSDGADYFLAAVYYMYEVVDVNHEHKQLRKGVKKRYVDRAINLVEQAAALAPDNALYKAVQGSLYGIKIPYTGFPALLILAKKCETTLNGAVAMAPDNPELKLIRLRTFVYFPNRYYGHLRKVIDADAGAVLDWVEEYLRAAGQDGELAGFFREIRNEVLYLVGTYYLEQLEDREKAGDFFDRIDPGSYYYYPLGR